DPRRGDRAPRRRGDHRRSALSPTAAPRPCPAPGLPPFDGRAGDPQTRGSLIAPAVRATRLPALREGEAPSEPGGKRLGRSLALRTSSREFGPLRDDPRAGRILPEPGLPRLDPTPLPGARERGPNPSTRAADRWCRSQAGVPRRGGTPPPPRPDPTPR